MLDPNAYRTAEGNAIRGLQNVRGKEIHGPDYFAHTGFMDRVSSLHDTKGYFDTMQTGRFEPYVEELGGLNEAERAEFIEKSATFARFYASTYQTENVPLPAADLMAHFALALKLRNLPDRRRILEIGPGTGLLSLFLADDPEVQCYDQIEITEAFYLIQSMLGSYFYGEGFHEHALPEPHPTADADLGMNRVNDAFLSYFRSYQPDATASISVKRDETFNHFPWWKIGRLYDRQYDVITANANLSEMDPKAMLFYLNIIQKSLRPGGYMLVQCLGGAPVRYPSIISAIGMFGLKPVYVLGANTTDHVNMGYPEGKHALPADAPKLVVANALFQRDVSADPARLVELVRSGPIFDSSQPLTRANFRLDGEGREPLSKSTLVEEVRLALQSK